MRRTAIANGVLIAVAIGCAGPGTQTRTGGWESQAGELANSQARLELRLEEVTRSLLAVRQRLDAVETSLKEMQAAQTEEAEPALRVVRLAPKERDEAAPAQTGGTAAADLYRRAFNAYREGRYGQAILDFEDFLRSYAEHEYADNAQYWIGESYYSQNQYEQAVLEFNRVLERYPQEAKVPDALLKIGNSYEKVGDRDRAKVFWERLVSQHPESEAARQARKSLSAEP